MLELKVNLLSLTRAVVYSGMMIVIENQIMHFKIDGYNGKTIMVGKYAETHQLFVLDCVVNPPEITGNKCFSAKLIGGIQYIELMHKRLLHIGGVKLKKMHLIAEKVKKMLDAEMHKCVTCAVAKSKQKAIHKTLLPFVNESLEKVYIDLIGKMPKSINEYEYILLISDNCTRQRWVVLLKHKSEAYKQFKAWTESVKARNKSKIGFI